MAESMTPKRTEIVEFIREYLYSHGYPPSVREIGEAVGLSSPSTVQAHLRVLQRGGVIERDPAKPRALKISNGMTGGVVSDIRTSGKYGKLGNFSTTDEYSPRVRNVPLVGDVAAGSGVLAMEAAEEMIPLPVSLVGTGKLFMLRVRGDSMIEAGILDGDYVVVRSQKTAENGEVVVAGIPGEEATVKHYALRNTKVVLSPANSAMSPIILSPSDVTIYGKVTAVFRHLQ
ncbi:MAG: transcriptional repressor LexA [Acidimicrobiales bacterium]